MDAIVYTSNAGSTKRYAEMLSGKINLPVFSLAEAKKKLKKGSKIIYLGWVLADNVKKLNKARNLYDVRVIGAVGLDSECKDKLELKNNINNDKEALFKLKGAFNTENLKGFYRFMIKVMLKMMLKPEAVAKLSEKEQESLKAFANSSDFVSEDNLKEMIEYINQKF